MQRLLSPTLFVLLVLLAGCKDEDLFDKPFFSTDNLPLEFSNDAIGSYALRAAYSDLSSGDIEEDCDVLAEFGFYFSDERQLVVTNDRAVRLLAEEPPENGTFSLPAPRLSPNKWYFFRPFINCNARSVSGELDSFRVDVDIAISTLGQPRRNNIIDHQLLFTGGQFTPPGTTIGYFLLAENGTDTLVGPIELSLAEAEDFPVEFPQFNTNYLLLPYINDGASYFFGETLLVFISDGWVYMGNLSVPLHEAEAVVVGDFIYLFGGCKNGECGPGNLNDSIFETTIPANGLPASIAWNAIGSHARTDFTKRFAGASFGVDEIIWHIFGKVAFENPPILQDDSGSRYIPSSNSVQEPFFLGQTLSDLVAFEQGGRYFFGAGVRAQSWRAEFYEFKIAANGIPSSAPVNSMPLLTPGGEVTIQGRSEAVSVLAGEDNLAGSGSTGASIRSDFFRFKLPSIGNPGGSWERVASLPGARRSAAAFSIDGRAFVGLGRGESGTYFKDWYEFSDESGPEGEWIERHPFPGSGRAAPAAFSINGYGCICGGVGAGNIGAARNFFNDCWLYVPTE